MLGAGPCRADMKPPVLHLEKTSMKRFQSTHWSHLPFRLAHLSNFVMGNANSNTCALHGVDFYLISWKNTELLSRFHCLDLHEIFATWLVQTRRNSHVLLAVLGQKLL